MKSPSTQRRAVGARRVSASIPLAFLVLASATFGLVAGDGQSVNPGQVSTYYPDEEQWWGDSFALHSEVRSCCEQVALRDARAPSRCVRLRAMHAGSFLELGLASQEKLGA